MSRRQGASALRGAPEPGLTTGVSWLTAEVLAEVSGAADLFARAVSRAEIARALDVDVAFVAATHDDAVASVEELQSADIAAVWTVDGVFGRVARAIGWVEALRMSAAEPGLLAARLDSELHEALVEVRAGIAAGADALLIADDLAGAGGPLLSPDYALDALMPCYHHLALETVRAEIPALFHSDGDIRALIPALARTGLAGLHLAGLDPLAFSANGTAARSAGLVVLGGISAASLPEGARDEGERSAAFAHSMGCAIVCDDGGITNAEQVSALGAALDAACDAWKRLGA